MATDGRRPAPARKTSEDDKWFDAIAPQVVVRGAPTPLHFQLRSLLVGMIEDGQIEPGRAIPPERALAAQFGVSLAPVRQAILDLVREGLLYRVRGKGTFLHSAPLVESDTILASFSGSMRAKGLPVEMRVLRAEAVRAVEPVGSALGVDGGKVLLLERLALVEGLPTALLTSYFPLPRFEGLEVALAETASLYAVLEEGFATVPDRADTTVELGRATTAQSALLAVPAGTALLMASGTTYDAANEPVEHFRVLYRPDKIRLRLEVHRYIESVVSRSNQADFHGSTLEGVEGA